MAGRRRLRQDVFAASGVVATIALIGATVVIAGGAYGAWKLLGVRADQVPMQVTFEADEAGDRLRILSAGPTGAWSRMAIRLVDLGPGGPGICIGDVNDGSPQELRNEMARLPCADGMNRLTDRGGPRVHVSTSPAKPLLDDFLQLCAESRAHGVRVMMLDIGAGTSLGTFGFDDIGPCGA